MCFQGRNKAGWGGVSNTERLAVLFPPESEEQRQAQSVSVRKGATVELDCALKHKGFPEAKTAVWLRDGIREMARLYDRSSFCIEATYPNPVKNQREVRNAPCGGFVCLELVLYGIRERREES